jgi:hypothetical protein
MAVMSAAMRGRPRRFPFDRAVARPARVRSLIRSLSCFASVVFAEGGVTTLTTDFLEIFPKFPIH